MRTLITIFTFVGALASASAVVLTVIPILRFPPILIVAGIALLLFELTCTQYNLGISSSDRFEKALAM